MEEIATIIWNQTPINLLRNRIRLSHTIKRWIHDICYRWKILVSVRNIGFNILIEVGSKTFDWFALLWYENLLFCFSLIQII